MVIRVKVIFFLKYTKDLRVNRQKMILKNQKQSPITKPYDPVNQCSSWQLVSLAHSHL